MPTSGGRAGPLAARRACARRGLVGQCRRRLASLGARARLANPSPDVRVGREAEQSDTPGWHAQSACWSRIPVRAQIDGHSGETAAHKTASNSERGKVAKYRLLGQRNDRPADELKTASLSRIPTWSIGTIQDVPGDVSAQ